MKSLLVKNNKLVASQNMAIYAKEQERFLQHTKNNEFTFRESPVLQGGGAGVIKTIYGNTVAINQTLNLHAGKTIHGLECSINNNKITLNGTVTETGDFTLGQIAKKVNGHKYFVCAYGFDGASYFNNSAYIYGYSMSGSFVKDKNIFTQTSESASDTIAIRLNTGSIGCSINNLSFYLMAIDITLIEETLGLTFNTVTDVENYLKLLYSGIVPDYIPYTENKLVDFNGSGLELESLNLAKTINSNNSSKGIEASINNGKITVTGDCTGDLALSILGDKGIHGAANYYDYITISEENSIKVKKGKYTINTGINIPLNKFLFIIVGKIGERAREGIAKVYWISNYTTINIDIENARLLVGAACLPSVGQYNIEFYLNINRGEEVKQFTPYRKNKLLFTDFPPLRKAGNVRDEYNGDAVIRRVGSVDLGTLNWSKLQIGSTGYYRFWSSETNFNIKITDVGLAINGLCLKYEMVDVNQTYRRIKGLSVNNTNKGIIIYDSDLQDKTAEEFKSLMSGVMFYYELAEYTREYHPSNMQYEIEPGGTEQLLPINESNLLTAPIICDIDYTERPLYALPDGIGAVDLGTLNWSQRTAEAEYNIFHALMPNDFSTGSFNAICEKYTQTDQTMSNAPDKSIFTRTSYYGTNNIAIRDTNYTDAAEFKKAMSGVMLFYKKAGGN